MPEEYVKILIKWLSNCQNKKIIKTGDPTIIQCLYYREGHSHNSWTYDQITNTINIHIHNLSIIGDYEEFYYIFPFNVKFSVNYLNIYNNYKKTFYLDYIFSEIKLLYTRKKLEHSFIYKECSVKKISGLCKIKKIK